MEEEKGIGPSLWWLVVEMVVLWLCDGGGGRGGGGSGGSSGGEGSCGCGGGGRG